MRNKTTNALRIWSRLTWVGFIGAFVAAVAFAFSVRVTVRPVFAELGQAGTSHAEVISEATHDVLTAWLPWTTGLLAALFLLLFVVAGLVFLIKAINRMGDHPPFQS
jgi:CDP-diglyceride synthetase